jgi:hypothetical protein
MIALYTVWYNFARINSAVKMGPRYGGWREQDSLDHG